MKWDLEELCEDAIVAYLKTVVTGNLKIWSAWEMDEAQYPCVIVFCQRSAPISTPAEWHDARMLDVRVAVQTEAADETDSHGVVVTTARDRNRAVRSDVISALGISDLESKLVEQGVSGIAFSGAQMVDVERSTEGRVLVSTINLEIVAEPVTGS